MKYRNKVLVLLFVVLITVVFWLTRDDDAHAGRLDEFARCLSDKGFMMYGAEWCSHCQNEKNAFGDSFKLVSYVECPAEPQKCLAVGINAYPTWIGPDGEKMVGEQGLEKLSQASDCEIKSKTEN